MHREHRVYVVIRGPNGSMNGRMDGRGLIEECSNGPKTRCTKSKKIEKEKEEEEEEEEKEEEE